MDQSGVSVLKKFLLCIFLVLQLAASSTTSEQKIYTLIIKALFPYKENILVWVDEEEKKKLFSSIPNITICKDKNDADILIVGHTQNIQSDSLIFTTNYHLLKEYQNTAIGGFFWQKGRPNLLFLNKNLKKHHIELPASMQNYIEKSL